VARFSRWLVAPQQNPSSWRVILWWEVRRIPFNLIIGAYGIVCLIVFLLAAESSGRIPPGEDAVEPIALLFAPFAVNLLYTLGWLVEVPVRLILPDLSPRFGPLLMKLGLALGLFFVTLPAAIWVAILLLQFAGAM